jgi:hypothetical protein
MLYLDPTSLPLDTRPPERSRVGSAWRLVQPLVRSWRRQRALLEWNRSLPRPPACAHLPDRIWRRRSALLSLHGEGTPR